MLTSEEQCHGGLGDEGELEQGEVSEGWMQTALSLEKCGDEREGRMWNISAIRVSHRSFSDRKSFCAPPVHRFLPSAPATTDFFTVSMILPIPECDTFGNIQNVAFSD